MKYRPFLSALSALAALAGARALAQTNTISSVAIGTASTASGTATGVATVTPLIGTALNQPGSVGNNLAGLQYVAGQIPLTGSPASIAFFALTGAAIPGGAANPATAFTSYGTLTSPTAVQTYIDVASKLTPNSYSGLTFAAANLGFGSGNFYMIHHTSGTDYLSEIVPGTATSTLIADLKPMSWTGPTAGGPASVGATGYFALAWGTGILSAGAPYADQSIYYLRTDSNPPNHVKFGVIIPALTGASSDTLDLTTAVGAFGASGYTTLAFSPTSVGPYGTNQFYYLRRDSATGNTILGRLNPSLVAGARTISDIANLGGVFDTLVFAPDATGPAGAWGSNQFYVAGALAPGAQSVSFAAIPDHNVGDVFAITPTASSGLDIDVTVVSGPATVQTTGVSGATPLSLRIFTVTTTGPGIVTLQARQAGRTAAPAFTANMLQQSFNVLGAVIPVITNSTSTVAGTAGTPFSFTIAASGSPSSFSASPLPAGLSIAAGTGVISGTPTAAGTTTVVLGATNSSGTGTAALVITVGSSTGVPIITSPASAPGTAGVPFAGYLITATGLPTSYTATGLPPGLTLNPATGAITGSPTTTGTYPVTITATNSNGTGTASLTITVGSSTAAPVITSPVTAPGTAGTPFVPYQIAATGLPTSYTATGLPPGLTLNPVTGAITGTPTTAGSYTVTLTATNSNGSSTATLTITVAATPFSRIVNLSARAQAGSGSQTLTLGFVVLGNNKTLLVRAIGPGLVPLGVASPLLDPELTLYSGNTPMAANTGWQNGGNAAAVASTAAQIGAFSLASGSADSALISVVNAGAYTAQIVGASGDSGTALAEVYDADSNLSARLLNASARMQINLPGGNLNPLTIGFVIVGNNQKTVLIRGVGPGLAAFGVTGVLANPQITIFSGGNQIASNANWAVGNNVAQIMATFAQVGAFPLASGSLDAALTATLPPGTYTVQITGVGNTGGVALLEIYDVQ